MPTKKKSFVKESPMETKPKHIPESSLARQDRRSWEAWTDKENHIFFDSLVRHSRNWAQIAADLVTKRQEQVRTYYYRVLRKISRMLSSVDFAFDNRDRIQTLMAMTSYWEAKCETKHEETTKEFSDAVKERILRQKQAVDMLRTKRFPAPEKVILQLLPRDEQYGEPVAQSGYNPKLQLTLKATKPISSVIDHLNKKWITESGTPVAPFRIRLYPMGTTSHRGWGIEDQEILLSTIYQQMGSPNACKFEYAWPEDDSSVVPPSASETSHIAAMEEADSAPQHGMYEDDEESLDRLSVGGVDSDMAVLSLQPYEDFQADYADDVLHYEHPHSGDDDDDMQQSASFNPMDDASFSQFLSGPSEFFEAGSLAMRSVEDDDEEEIQQRVVPQASSPPAVRSNPATRVVFRVNTSPSRNAGVSAGTGFSFTSGLEVSSDFLGDRGSNSTAFNFAQDNSNSIFNFGQLNSGSGIASNNNSLFNISFSDNDNIMNESGELFGRFGGAKPRHDRPALDQQEQAAFSSLQHKPKRARKGDDSSSRL